MKETQKRIDSEECPQVIVTQPRYLGGEYQIEQGTGNAPVDLDDPCNDIVSISREQAIEIAKFTLSNEG